MEDQLMVVDPVVNSFAAVFFTKPFLVLIFAHLAVFLRSVPVLYNGRHWTQASVGYIGI